MLMGAKFAKMPNEVDANLAFKTARKEAFFQSTKATL